MRLGWLAEFVLSLSDQGDGLCRASCDTQTAADAPVPRNDRNLVDPDGIHLAPEEASFTGRAFPYRGQVSNFMVVPVNSSETSQSLFASSLLCDAELDFTTTGYPLIPLKPIGP